MTTTMQNDVCIISACRDYTHEVGEDHKHELIHKHSTQQAQNVYNKVFLDNDGKRYCQDHTCKFYTKEVSFTHVHTILNPDMPKHDNVNHPKHYTSHPSGIECIEITRHMSFNIGNAIKYLWRADEKGVPIEDLKKAVWYIQDEINKREASGRPTR